MRIKTGWTTLNILALFIIAIFAGSIMASEVKKTIVGVVTESYQIITDNDEAYDIGESELGDKIIENAGKKVKVTGKVEYDEETDTRTITVESFTVIEETETETETEPELEPDTDPEMDYEAEPEF